MDSKDFKAMFSEFARASGFEFAYGGWFKESPECVIVLELQKSNFGDYYELNIKVFIKGLRGRVYARDKNMVKKFHGDVFWRPPEKYKRSLNLAGTQVPEFHRKMLGELFDSFVVPTTTMAQTRSGLAELKKQGLVYLFPAVESALKAEQI